MARKREAPVPGAQAVTSTSAYDAAVEAARRPDGLEERAAEVARRFRVDHALPPRQRAVEIARRSGNTMSAEKLNLAYMHAIVDAVEGGRRFRRTPLSPEEIAAARRATGRARAREPGEDDE